MLACLKEKNASAKMYSLAVVCSVCRQTHSIMNTEKLIKKKEQVNCFMPSQPVQLYLGEKIEKKMEHKG